MNKKKFIEKKSGYRSKHNQIGYNRLRNKHINSDLLPKRESMRQNSKKHNHNHKSFLNYQHIDNFLKERIGYNWDDIYSELLSKTKGKYKYKLRENGERWWLIETTIVYNNDKHPPRNIKGNILINILFVDENNIISYYNSPHKIITEYRNRILIKKLKSILRID